MRTLLILFVLSSVVLLSSCQPEPPKGVLTRRNPCSLSPLGLADLTGNVWAWCEDPKVSYQDILNQTPVRITGQTERVQRGGSFLCEPGWCHGYRVSGRSGSTAETALMHVGFRCVKDG